MNPVHHAMIRKQNSSFRNKISVLFIAAILLSLNASTLFSKDNGNNKKYLRPAAEAGSKINRELEPFLESADTVCIIIHLKDQPVYEVSERYRKQYLPEIRLFGNEMKKAGLIKGGNPHLEDGGEAEYFKKKIRAGIKEMKGRIYAEVREAATRAAIEIPRQPAYRK